MSRGTRTLSRTCPFCAYCEGQPVWHEDGYDYVRCSQCGGVFSDVDEATYRHGRHNVWDEDASGDHVLGFYGDARRAAHDTFLRELQPYGRRRLLDVGCGLGFFLERARERGWAVHGCEPSPAWAARAGERLGAEHVTRGEPSAVVPPEGGFDLITVWDVIEHIFDPVPFLRAINQLLAPCGKVFLRTPNLDYVLPVYRLRRRAGDPVELGPLNHVVYFTVRSMRRALCDADLHPVRWLALPPPQVATLQSEPSRRYAPRSSLTVAAKTTWARAAGLALRATGGRLAVASDLDVIAARGALGSRLRSERGGVGLVMLQT